MLGGQAGIGAELDPHSCRWVEGRGGETKTKSEMVRKAQAYGSRWKSGEKDEGLHM